MEINPPVEQSTTTQLFSDSSTAIRVLAGTYASMVNDGMITYNSSQELGLYADELNTTTGDASQTDFYQSAVQVDNTSLNGFWSYPYQYIYRSNLCIERAAQSTALPATTRAQLIYESKFIRAYCYFLLVRLFGDVPLVLSTDFRINASLDRKPKADVLSQIVSDLKDAAAALGSDYPSGEHVRPTKWVAAALLAQVYLYQHDWVSAEKAANDVIASGKYALETDLSRVFLKNNNEAIWQMMSPDGYGMYEGYYFIPGDAATVPNFPIATTLMNAFETDDRRRTSWIGATTIGSETYFYPHKYKTTGSEPSTEYYTLMRLAEQYLIRAEAASEQGKLSEAAQDLNTIRARAGLPPTIAADQAGLRTAICHERQVELFTENGHRWFDLERTGKADSVLTMLKPQSWKPTGVLLPIPLAEIKANPFLHQNPGY